VGLDHDDLVGLHFHVEQPVEVCAKGGLVGLEFAGNVVDLGSGNAAGDGKGRRTIGPAEDDGIGLRLLLHNFVHEGCGEDHLGRTVRHRDGSGFTTLQQDVMVLGARGLRLELRVGLLSLEPVPSHQVGDDHIFLEVSGGPD
jgi:hypothetical protein